MHPGDPEDVAGQAVVAWRSENEFTRELQGHLQLYRATWQNPQPEVEVRAIDFVSTMTDCAPWLVAMTVE